ncbi:MAG: LlaJI family restriction endonuclease [Fibrobacter sp.]|nr:LlaJI family restriction endonuclease [Fibrobacter sp.]
MNGIRISVAQKGSDFVGLNITSETRCVTFPMGYAIDSADDADITQSLRSEILLLIRKISDCEKLQGERVCRVNKNDLRHEFPIGSILFLIEDFLNRGSYYTEKEKIMGEGLPGKISWSSTIKRIKPIVSERGIAFLDFIVHKSRIKQDRLITELHKYCVRKSFELLGFLYTAAMPEQGLINEADVKKNKAYYVGFLDSKISETHLEQNAELFVHMKNVIQNFDSDDTISSATYGTNSFHTVWESMVDKLYGSVSKTEIDQYYPCSKWKKPNGEKLKNNAPLRPDTIMVCKDGNGSECCFILDSKYYSYAAMTNNGVDESEEDSHISVSAHGSIPGTDSIQKQITYAEFIDNSKTPPKSERLAKYKFDPDKIFNAFILPGYVPDGDGVKYIGYAEADWNTQATEGYRKIYGFLLDTKTIMQKHSLANARQTLAKRILRENVRYPRG